MSSSSARGVVIRHFFFVLWYVTKNQDKKNKSMQRTSFAVLRDYCAKINAGQKLPYILHRSAAVQARFDEHHRLGGFDSLYTSIEQILQTKSHIITPSQFPFYLEHDILQYDCWSIQQQRGWLKTRMILNCGFLTKPVTMLKGNICNERFTHVHVFVHNVDPDDIHPDNAPLLNNSGHQCRAHLLDH